MKIEIVQKKKKRYSTTSTANMKKQNFIEDKIVGEFKDDSFVFKPWVVIFYCQRSCRYTVNTSDLAT